MRFLTSFIIALLLAAAAMADSLDISSRIIASSSWKQGDAAYWLGGEHNYVQWTGTAALTTEGDADTTVWIQYSPVYNIPDSSNFDKAHLFPRMFTLDVSVALTTTGGNNDSLALSGIRVEYAWANGVTKPILNADSSFALLADGNSARFDYLTWTFEDWPDFLVSSSALDNYTWRYPIKVLAPGFIRFIFTSPSSLVDPETLTWTLTGVY